MKIVFILAIILVSLCIIGCSMPTATVHRPLYSFTKVEKTTKAGFFGRKKTITIKDFRQNEAYDEDIEALKQEAEKYIPRHPELSGEAMDNLRHLRVTQGSTRDEVTFLLGKPDKVMKTDGAGRYGATEVWIYKINKVRVFTVFIIPLFPVREAYYLYFKDNALLEIERHFLKQVVEQHPGPGIVDSG